MKIAQYEIDKFSKVIQAFGGELLSVDQDERVVKFSFESSEKMVTLIKMFKADRRIANRIRCNSKIVNGMNILTVDPL